MANYCPHCMRKISDDVSCCDHCGKSLDVSNLAHQLPINTLLSGRYLVGKAIGEGGFGIVYMGCDLRLDMQVAIKEYYPSGMVGRVNTYSNSISLSGAASPEWFKTEQEKFLTEARHMSKYINLPHVVSVTDFFYENGTAYTVMKFLNGQSLSQALSSEGPVRDFSKVYKLLRPVMETLEIIHKDNLVHRDISPSNLMFDEFGQLVLLDFGAARVSNPEEEKSLSVVLKHGYAPPEQYQSHGKQGPWTDVYALCATMYKTITGVTPPSVADRMVSELARPSSLNAQISPVQEEVLMRGLAMDSSERIQNMRELIEAFDSADGASCTHSGKKGSDRDPSDTASHKGKRRKLIPGLVVLFVLILSVAAFNKFLPKPQSEVIPVVSVSPSATPGIPEPTATPDIPEATAVPEPTATPALSYSYSIEIDGQEYHAETEDELNALLLQSLFGNNYTSPENVPENDVKINSNPIVIVDQKATGTSYGYSNGAFTVKNVSGGNINTLTLNIKILDENQVVIATTHPQQGVVISDGESIVFDAGVNAEKGAYSMKLDGYSFFTGTDHNGEYIKGHFEQAEELVLN